MRINYLYEVHQGNWTQGYHYTVLKALDGWDVFCIDAVGLSDEQIADAVADAPSCDVWYCMSFLDRWLYPVALRAPIRGEKIIVHNHGGMETRDSIALERGRFDTIVLPSIADSKMVRILFNSKSNALAFGTFYGIKPRSIATDHHETSFRVVGFPIHDLEHYVHENNANENNVERRGIVVPGRFSETKQTMLAAEILRPFREQTTFCTGVMPTKSYAAALDALGFSVVFVQGMDYYRLLARSKVAFTASMADSLNSSMAEAASARAVLVAPKWGPFTEYANEIYLYEPFSVVDARQKIRGALGSSSETSCSDVSDYLPKEVARRIREVVSEFQED